jgi:hypothetical protein
VLVVLVVAGTPIGMSLAVLALVSVDARGTSGLPYA